MQTDIGILKDEHGVPFVQAGLKGDGRTFSVIEVPAGVINGDTVEFEIVASGQYHKVARIIGKVSGKPVGQSAPNPCTT